MVLFWIRVAVAVAASFNSCLARSVVETDKNGFQVHRVESEYQGGETTIRVLLPDGYDYRKAYCVLYVLPVIEHDNRRFGDGLIEVRQYDFHNTHQLICVAPEFSHLPWYADHDLNPQKRDESYLLKVVLPLIEDRYSVRTDAKGRLLVGFSKSGWGAFTLLLRNPDTFYRAAGWDSGIRVDTGPIEEADRQERIRLYFGTTTNFERYRLSALIRGEGTALGGKARLFYYNTEGRRAVGGALIHQLLVDEGIPHRYLFEPKRTHRWDSGWLPQAVEFLVGE